MSDDPIKDLASTLFVVDENDRVHLEYPFLFLCICVGLLVKGCSKFLSRDYKNK